MTKPEDPVELVDALAPGSTVGDFVIERVLGQGGFGITYLAHDRIFDRKVAIKEFLPTDLARREADQRIAPRATNLREGFAHGLAEFVREARMLDRLEHRNVVKVRSFFNQNDTAYLVMEYVQGPTLSQVLPAERVLSTRELDALLLPLLDGLDHVHSRSYLHRDIKPENIILREGRLSEPVLIDFGAARESVGSRSRSVAALVSAGYTPLEQYSSNLSLAPASDVYAIAAVAYRCLAGSAPPSATERALEDTARSFGSLIGLARPADYAAGLDAALALRLRDRTATIVELRRSLYPEAPVLPLVEAPEGAVPHEEEVAAMSAPGSRSAGAMRDRSTRTMRLDFVEALPADDPGAPVEAATTAGTGQATAGTQRPAPASPASGTVSAQPAAAASRTAAGSPATGRRPDVEAGPGRSPATPMLVSFLALLSGLPFIVLSWGELTAPIMGQVLLNFPLAAFLGTWVVRRFAAPLARGGIGARLAVFLASYLLISVLSTLLQAWPAMGSSTGSGAMDLASHVLGRFWLMASHAPAEFLLFAVLLGWATFDRSPLRWRGLRWLEAFPRHNQVAMGILAAGAMALAILQ